MQLGLVYSKWPDRSHISDFLPYGLIGYSNNNFTGDPEDRKSVMGHCFFLNGVIVLWYNKKQKTVSILTTKAEYITIRHAIRKGV